MVADTQTCPECGYRGPLDTFDTGLAEEGFIFCVRCLTEFPIQESPPSNELADVAQATPQRRRKRK